MGIRDLFASASDDYVGLIGVLGAAGGVVLGL